MPEESTANIVGLVAGTEDATPLRFHIAIDERAYLQLDDVVTTPGRQAVGIRMLRFVTRTVSVPTRSAIR